MKSFVNNLIERLTSIRESEIIIGDMCEEYESRLEESGKFRADIHYFFDFISLITHRVLKKRNRQQSNFFTMLSNYLKIAFRQLGRQRLHNTINIAGLAIGLAVTFIISLFVMQELSYDKFHVNKDRLYVLPMTWKFGETQVSTSANTSAGGPLMKELFNKEVENFVRISGRPTVFMLNDAPISEPDVVVADSTFFDVLTFPMIIGDPKRALTDPASIVLTEKSATKYFGNDWKTKDVMSQSITAQNGRVFKITGVAKDPPVESHLQFDMLMSMSSMPKSFTEPAWESSDMVTYMLLDANASAAEMVADIPNRVAKKYGAEQNEFVELDLIPIQDVYLYNKKYMGFSTSSDIRYVYVFSAIAILVLIIAIINYMNLSTARSLERAREVGVRKVVGAVRGELFWQFISESLLISFTAVVFAIMIAFALLPIFNFISGKSLAIDFGSHPEWIGALVFIWLLISLLGGAYPAMVLSSFRPASVLKGKSGNAGRGNILRKSLVVFQFGISIFLIVCTLTINEQLTYMVNTKLGFDKDQLMVLDLDSVSMANIEAIKNELSTIAGVEEVSAASETPASVNSQSTVRGGDLGDKKLLVPRIAVQSGFVHTTGLEIISGTDLTKDRPKSDKDWEYLLNESAVKLFGWTNEDAVGKKMLLWGNDGVVKGVVRDFHFSPLHKPIGPLVIHTGQAAADFTGQLLIRIDGGKFEDITIAIDQKWKKIVPTSPLLLSFVNEQYQNLYKSETRLGKIMDVFSLLAILIAGLGLFGLASYTIMQRTKELGIRKVLGASLSTLLMLVSNSFIRLVVVAFVIAAPISWYVMTNWLSTFAYPVGFNWVVLIGAGVAAVLVASLTVMYHAVNAARVNPAQTLRSE